MGLLVFSDSHQPPWQSLSLVSAYRSMRIAFVEDELANQRLGLRMLAKLGVKPEHVTVLADGACIWRG